MEINNDNPPRNIKLFLEIAETNIKNGTINENESNLTYLLKNLYKAFDVSVEAKESAKAQQLKYIAKQEAKKIANNINSISK